MLFLATVTPFVGVWIETQGPFWWILQMRSHPSWVCGLKQAAVNNNEDATVTPFVGVWIETPDGCDR